MTELLAAYWTLAGDVWPGAPSEVSPFPLEERAAAAAAESAEAYRKYVSKPAAAPEGQPG